MLYAGTDFGAFVSIDGGRQWQVLGGDLPSVQVSDLQKYQPRDRVIVIATYGRGMWAMDAVAVKNSPADTARINRRYRAGLTLLTGPGRHHVVDAPARISSTMFLMTFDHESQAGRGAPSGRCGRRRRAGRGSKRLASVSVGAGDSRPDSVHEIVTSGRLP